jgi:hypothetical protein
MATDVESSVERGDPAAVLACALSLRTACLEKAKADPQLNLSEAYNGMDEFMRELMRVGTLFEDWACAHVVFEATSEVWPYFLEDRFGTACLEVVAPDGLEEFDSSDCLRVALHLGLPVRAEDGLPVPVDVQAPNPVVGSEFQEFRIRTMRKEFEEQEAFPFTVSDDPFDEDFGAPYFAVYGVEEGGVLEHIADRKTYSAVLSLVRKLSPGVQLPLEPICISK